jgi:hypothetical protein
MAAPDAVDDSTMQPDTWGPQDQAVGPGGNGQTTSGASVPVDERSADQEPRNPEYPRGSSVSDNEAFREKQVKVLRSFLSVLCLLVRSSFLGLVSSARLAVLDLPHSRPNLLLLFCVLKAGLLCASNNSSDSACLDWCLPSAVQPNKVYIGGLPEHTRQEDLQTCFGKIGNIVNIELKSVKLIILSSAYSTNIGINRVGYGFVVSVSRWTSRNQGLNSCLISRNSIAEKPQKRA